MDSPYAVLGSLGENTDENSTCVTQNLECKKIWLKSEADFGDLQPVGHGNGWRALAMFVRKRGMWTCIIIQTHSLGDSHWYQKSLFQDLFRSLVCGSEFHSALFWFLVYLGIRVRILENHVKTAYNTPTIDVLNYVPKNDVSYTNASTGPC